jgi:hypothetical protein
LGTPSRALRRGAKKPRLAPTRVADLELKIGKNGRKWLFFKKPYSHRGKTPKMEKVENRSFLAKISEFS